LIAGKYDPSIKVPENVELLGCIYNQKSLAEYYSMADVTLLTSRKETYSMICAESLCCGTPVVGFKAGAPEQISIPEFSCFVQFGDVPALLYNTRGMIEKGLDKEKIANIAAEIYSKEKMVSDYIGVYNDTKD
jgi:glycosyltransferase involved in cell wall biosynthesis